MWRLAHNSAAPAVAGEHSHRRDLIHHDDHEHRHANDDSGEHVPVHEHGAGHMHDHGPGIDQARDHRNNGGLHRHGPFGRAHGHALPAGEIVTMRGLITLGISGGLLPCPSALVVLLSAIALHRVGFGMLLIVAFSLGLAGVLTGIGLLLAYARRLADRLPADSGALRVLPVLSAFVVALLGIAVTVQSLASGGIIRIG